ncbi:MAG: NAD-dependent epimerase/dehydratase [Rhodospirillaceae bacterium]|nr:NAD-dependent epimerase/dehydratase [Rhodospirillaceae bacterium]
MLTHLNDSPAAPARVVIMGAGGFVGNAAADRLESEGVEVLRLTRQEVDLLAADAAQKLAVCLRPDDCLIVTSALAPCKDNEMLVDNLAMMTAVCAALEKSPVAHVVYISSDAVYSDSPEALSEESIAAPDSLHGIMHVAREVMLKNTLKEIPLAILRPSLLYGVKDPHNGYGPNQFRRKAAKGEDIALFGEGEERRDHILIDDVAEIIRRVVRGRSEGVLNVVTGEVASFREIAELVVSHFDAPVQIKGSPRSGPMPHDGYRPFDAAACRKAFPDFQYTLLPEGLALVHRQMMESS